MAAARKMATGRVIPCEDLQADSEGPGRPYNKY